MENWNEKIINWKKYIYINWAYIENEPIKENFKEILRRDIKSIYKLMLIVWTD